MIISEQIKTKIRQSKPFLRDRFKAKEIALFGSYATGKQSDDSDIDVLVEFSEPVGFFTFLGLEEYLEKLLGREVDLVTKNALKPGIGRQILEQVSYV
ncbi:MAG: nucleotidyltransferase family protein [Candidatus Cloacimonetes bacterium]|nr:nucleotidyltransferase family protein [Candidatus Cloacimonadota bacterium]